MTKLTERQRALRGLVFSYLSKNYPVAARLFEAQAVLDDFDSGVDVDPANKDGFMVAALNAIEKTYGRNASLASVLARRQDHSASSAGKKKTPSATPKVAPKKAPIPPSSDDDEEVPVRVPAAKKPTPKTSPKLAPTKRPVVHDDSDDDTPAPAKKPSPKLTATKKKAVVSDTDDDVPVAPKAAKKPTPKASPKLAPAAAKKPVVNDSDSDDDAPKPRKAPTPKVAAKKPAVSDSDDEVPVQKKKLSPKAAPAKPPVTQDDDASKAAFQKKQPGERFCRIDVNAVQFANERLKDNRCRDDTANFMQNAKMLAVRGKEFNKHKQKNKAKLYAAGVDQGVHSFKFDDE